MGGPFVGLVPTAMTVVALAVTLGVYEQHLRSEPRDAATLRLVRQLGLFNVAVANVLVASLVMTIMGAPSTTILTSLLCGLSSTISVATVRFDAQRIS
jgi:UDP-N-acetylmuramyl tripeptide synthase